MWEQHEKMGHDRHIRCVIHNHITSDCSQHRYLMHLCQVIFLCCLNPNTLTQAVTLVTEVSGTNIGRDYPEDFS
jgi:LPS sulfotransferase NodH